MHTDADVVLAIYAGISSDDALQGALGLIARRFACPGAAVLYVDHKRPNAAVALAHGVLADAEVNRLYRTTYGAHDPAPGIMAQLGVGEVSSTDHLFDRDEIARHGYFLSFYHRIGLGGAMAGPVLRTDDHIGLLAVQRGLDRRPFDADDLAAFRGIMPHMAQALALRGKFYAIEARAAGLEEAIEPINVGIMTFREDGVLDHANLMARAILAREDGLFLDRQGRLHTHDHAVEARLRRWFARRDFRVEAEALSAPRRGAGASYALRARRVPARGDLGATTSSSIVISDPARPVGDAASLLAAAYDLTPASLRLTGALIGGIDLKTYARQAGISIHTAKHHLNTAFAATGTRRQTDLVRLAVSLVRDLS